MARPDPENYASVPKRMAALASNAANKPAIHYKNTSITFAELETRARHLAGYLANLGVKEGHTVALCVERSIDWVVSALGVLQTGAAYVPLDIGWPTSRLSYAISDSASSVVISPRSLFETLNVDARCLDLYAENDQISSAQPMEEIPIPANSLAYLIYTSGSTGVPKGVELAHAGLSNLIDWHSDAFKVSTNDSASQLAGLGFDAAVWEIWANLCAGASLYIADEDTRMSAELIQRWLIENSITVSFVPTVFASTLITMVWPENTKLRYLLTGGETLMHAPPRLLPFTVVNNYGPTECTVVATSCHVTSKTVGRPTIGKPIDNTTIYVMNDKMESIPDGKVGELCLCGIGIARGYRNLPDLTHARFVRSPDCELGSKLMYRTGDLGRRLPNGEIEFVGRIDRQVKIRGQRIELDEIGSVLEAHEDISFATAKITKNEHDDDQIVGYILFNDQCSLSTKDLQTYLVKHLPEIMIPKVFVVLKKRPISVNGKIDLSLLPEITEEVILGHQTHRDPSTKIEREVLSILQDLLKSPRVNLDTNFFLAGGHSLLGMQLLLRIQEKLHVNFTLRELFAAPTPEKLAVAIEQKRMEIRLSATLAHILPVKPTDFDLDLKTYGLDEHLIPKIQSEIELELGKSLPGALLQTNASIKSIARALIEDNSTAEAFPQGIIPFRKGSDSIPIFWIHYLNTNLAGAMDSNQAFMHVSLSAQDIKTLGSDPSLEMIARQLAVKIPAAFPDGPYILGGYCLGGILAYEVASQLKARGHEVSLLILLDTPSPSYFDHPNVLTPRIMNPGYLLKRIHKLGLKSSLEKIGKRINKIGAARPDPQDSAQSQMDYTQALVEDAAMMYKPPVYDGDVVLILAEDHPPHIDFLSEWGHYIPNGLRARYLLAHHSDLMSGSAVNSVAKALASEIRALATKTIAASTPAS